MERRSFFRALIGAPVVGAAAVVPAAPQPVLARAAAPMCECGFELVWKRAYDPEDNYDGRRGGLFGGGIEADNPTPRREYLVCLNRRCRHCNVPLAPPRVELAPADPRMVAAVDAQIAREEEESRRLKARAEEEARQWADYHAKYTQGVSVRIPRELFEDEMVRSWRGWEARR